MSRRNGTFCPKVGEMGVGKTGVGETGVSEPGVGEMGVGEPGITHTVYPLHIECSQRVSIQNFHYIILTLMISEGVISLGEHFHNPRLSTNFNSLIFLDSAWQHCLSVM